MELTSENDLFFHYSHTLDEAGFRAVQEQQKLMVDFAEYHTVLIRMLSTCIKEPHSHLAVFVMQRAGRAHLDFIQNMEYKFIELLSVAFCASDDETVRAPTPPIVGLQLFARVCACGCLFRFARASRFDTTP